MATEGTKFQINYKLNDGTLINLYAGSVTELESGLADLGMIASLIRTVGNDLHGGATSLTTTLVDAGVRPSVAAVAHAFNATPVAAPAAPAVGGNTCRHGVMALREGTSARGPWKGYMCAAPKGATDKCDTIWVR
jgi:hypothetical protein